jgi:L-ascorbate metabolism protein UlaG (beta-lactamase superfamily)
MLAAQIDKATPELVEHVIGTNQGDRGDGGPLAFLIETPAGTIWWNDTSGCWTGIAGRVRPDLAIIAAAGRPNLDGEPYQGSLADFVVEQARLLDAPRVLLCHHDDWLPPVTRPLDPAPIAAAVAGAGRELIPLAIGETLTLS